MSAPSSEVEHPTRTVDGSNPSECTKQRIAGRIDGLRDAYVTLQGNSKLNALRSINADIEHWSKQFAALDQK